MPGVCVCCGGGGYSDIFIHTYGLDHLFFWFNFFFFFFFFFGGGGVQKKYEYIWGYEEIVDIFGRSSHYWTHGRNDPPK